MRVHVTGASGAGVSTLGRALAAANGAAWFDTDDVYWMPTRPPFTTKRDVDDRVHLLRLMLSGAPACVLSGALVGWGDPLVPLFDAVVFVRTPREVRLERLGRRQAERFGTAVAPGGDMHATHLAFLEWARGYDEPAFDGRSLHQQEAWLARLTCAVVRVDGERPTPALVGEIAQALG